MRKLVLFLSLGVAFLIAAFFYVYTDRRGSTPSFLVGKVERGSILSTVSSSGTLSSVITVLVGSQVSGQIQEILVDFNSDVRKDQVIAKIDSESFQARMRQAEAELDVARANVVIQQAAVERARAELENSRAAHSASTAQKEKAKVAVTDANQDLSRKQRLHKSSIISESDIDKARAIYDQTLAQLNAATADRDAQVSVIRSREAALKMAEGQVTHAKAQMKQREAALHQSKIDLERTIIRSPVDGVVIQRNVDVGQTVAASLQAPTLFTIAKDLRKMQVETSVDEADIGRTVFGQAATFTVDAFPGREFRGQVEQIRKAPLTVQNVVTYTVVVSAENPDLRLLPGMTANVKIVVEERTDALKVPNAALRFSPPGSKSASDASSSGATPSSSASGEAGESIERVNRLIEVLGLDENQQAQVRAIFSEGKKKIQEMRKKGVPPEEIRAQVVNIREKGRVSLLAILNQDQRGKLAQLSAAKAINPVGKGRVWIVGHKGGTSAIPVKTGISDGSFTEILSGDLKPGQEVIVGMNPSSLSSTEKKKFGF